MSKDKTMSRTGEGSITDKRKRNMKLKPTAKNIRHNQNIGKCCPSKPRTKDHSQIRAILAGQQWVDKWGGRHVSGRKPERSFMDTIDKALIQSALIQLHYAFGNKTRDYWRWYLSSMVSKLNPDMRPDNGSFQSLADLRVAHRLVSCVPGSLEQAPWPQIEHRSGLELHSHII